MQIAFILSLIFATIIAIFALKNADKVLIDFIFTKVEISQAIIIFVSAVLGAIIVAALGFIRSFKLKKKNKDLNNKLNSLEIERNELIDMLDDIDDTKSLKDWYFEVILW